MHRAASWARLLLVLIALTVAGIAAPAWAQTQPAAAVPLASTVLYTETAHDCHGVDLSTWRHPARTVMEDAGVKIIKVELCNDGKYPIFTVGFKYDPQGQTGDYFGPLYAKMAQANGFWPFSFVDIDDALIIDVGVDQTTKNLSVSFEEFSSAPAPAGTGLSQIFNRNMLSAQVSYLESITGPAWKVFPGATPSATELRIYQVDGCQVGAGILNGAVQSLGLKLSSSCDVDLNRFIVRTPPVPSATTMTFGAFENSVGHGSFTADCLDGCGNADDPSVYDHYVGPQADDNLEIVASASAADGATAAAAGQWESLMMTKNGQFYVDHLLFNCDGEYDAQAASFLQNVPITTIFVGWNLAGPWSSCQTQR